MLELVNISKYYGTKQVLKNFSYKFESNLKYILTGSNGVGKSTLLHIMAGVITSSSGSISYLLGDLGQSLGWVPANASSFLPELTGRENLLFFYSLQNKDLDDFELEVKRWSSLCEFDFLDEKVLHFSSGMLQKLNFLRGIIHKPQVLLLDEPLENLDIRTTTIIKKYLIEFDGTLIFASHRLNEWIDLKPQIINIENLK